MRYLKIPYSLYYVHFTKLSMSLFTTNKEEKSYEEFYEDQTPTVNVCDSETCVIFFTESTVCLSRFQEGGGRITSGHVRGSPKYQTVSFSLEV